MSAAARADGSRRAVGGAAAAAASVPDAKEKVEPPPYGRVIPFGDATYGVYRDDVFVVVPREPAEQADLNIRMFWAAAQPYELKPAKKRKRKGSQK